MMKKVVAIVCAIIMCLSLTACGGNKKAFEASKVAYENVNAAYISVEQFADDIYGAWMAGIYDEDELTENGVKHLASELSISEADIRAGAVYAYAELIGKEVSELNETEKKNCSEQAELLFVLLEDNLFTLCVEIVRGAYTANGKADEIQAALEGAKLQMKELSEKYSDYEYYPSLKGYYTTTKSFFEFCQNPTGSFEQIKDTLNDYKNEARDYSSDLDYIFEE